MAVVRHHIVLGLAKAEVLVGPAFEQKKTGSEIPEAGMKRDSAVRIASNVVWNRLSLRATELIDRPSKAGRDAMPWWCTLRRNHEISAQILALSLLLGGSTADSMAHQIRVWRAQQSGSLIFKAGKKHNVASST